MKLEGPVDQYLKGDKPSHCALGNLHKHIKVWPQEEMQTLLQISDCLTQDLKPTKTAAQRGIIDLCEKKVLWNILEVKKALVAAHQLVASKKAQQEAARQAKAEKLAQGPSWVDLGTVGTYFGVSNIVVGKWLDQLGLRGVPEMERNSSGDFDMLDMANQAKKKQAAGFIGKEPTARALEMGAARKITVTNRKQQEIEITQWNLDLLKTVLQRAGHELNHGAMLKGKGKNSDVKVITADDRAKELYLKWQQLIKQGKSAEAERIFAKQPKPILLKVEALMNKPGFLVK